MSSRLKVAVVATIEVDPRVAHVTDAGLLHGRMPAGLRRSIAGLVTDQGGQR
jgi:hypothetical protein